MGFRHWATGIWGLGGAKAPEGHTGVPARRGGSLDRVGPGPSRQGRGRWAGRVANASRPHLGHHFLELALRHRHGGHLAASVPVGRGSAAPGLPQAAPHSSTPSRQPPTPPPLTGSRPPRQTFRFLYVTSEVIPEAGLVPTYPKVCCGRVLVMWTACSDGGNWAGARPAGVHSCPLTRGAGAGRRKRPGKVLPISFND